MARTLFRISKRPYFWGERRLVDLGLSAHAVAVYCVLASCANRHDHCWPSHRYIAKRIGISERTSIRAVKELVRHGAIKKVRLYDASTDRHLRAYELVDLDLTTAQSDSQSPMDDKGDLSGLTGTTVRKCQRRTTNKDIDNKESKNEESGHDRTDSLLELFADRFHQRYGHRPTNDGSLEKWKNLRSKVSPEIMKAKLEAWWEYPLPRAYQGNRTLGCFVQFFDDITLPPSPADRVSPSSTLSPENWITEMKAGSFAGRQHFAGIVGDVTDSQAIRSTLRVYGGIQDDKDIDAIIDACRGAR